MCHFRRVKNIYMMCGHTQDLKEEIIVCADAHCKFSPRHPKNCFDCKHTCWQYRQYPEQYAPQIASLCPTCNIARSYAAA
ncbi:hypothetical protein BV25DRAFT_1826013 [Artomyces pyxidatus]|uniref:Uncharacterized protein n=1 Tax=Artomyces pyxidatus TaxID=48021 RepID=A0ACB8T101_9AGAM|nr:hypothetical protein BV25DRAFT_1826013 [Artomyces pyxidatus]